MEIRYPKYFQVKATTVIPYACGLISDIKKYQQCVIFYFDGFIKCGVLWTVCGLSIHARHEWVVHRLMDPSKA